MKLLISGVLTLGLLAACGESTTDTGGPGTGGPGTGGPSAPGNGSNVSVPAALAADLSQAVYNPTTGSLQLTIKGLDAPLVSPNFVRTPALDVPSADGTTTYEAFTYQTTTQNRQYLALFAKGSAVSAGIVGTEMQFASSFGGTSFDRHNPAPLPTTGSAIFRGGYTGLINRAPNSTNDRSTRVTGDATISVNLTESLIEGSISNRAYADVVDGTGQLANIPLPDIALLQTMLAGGGFQGTVILGNNAVGNYAGILGGSVANASAGSVPTGTSPAEVAGTMAFKPFNNQIFEWGVFLAPVCGGPSASPNCP